MKKFRSCIQVILMVLFVSGMAAGQQWKKKPVDPWHRPNNPKAVCDCEELVRYARAYHTSDGRYPMIEERFLAELEDCEDFYMGR